MIKFKTKQYGTLSIEKIDVERETEHCVFIIAGSAKIECRRTKKGEYENYFDSWEDAHDHILSIAGRRLDNVRRTLGHAQDMYGNVKGMKQPETPPQPTKNTPTEP